MKNAVVVLNLLMASAASAGTLTWTCEYAAPKPMATCSLQAAPTADEVKAYLVAKDENDCLAEGIRILQTQSKCEFDLGTASVKWDNRVLSSEVKVTSQNCDAVTAVSVKKTAAEIAEEKKTRYAISDMLATDLLAANLEKKVNQSKTLADNESKKGPEYQKREDSDDVTVSKQLFEQMSESQRHLFVLTELDYQMRYEASLYKAVATCKTGYTNATLNFGANKQRIQFDRNEGIENQICVQ